VFKFTLEPYVPSDDEELGFNDIRASYAGGKDGMEITNQLLPQIDVPFLFQFILENFEQKWSFLHDRN
jgi:hypothetical protein